MSLNFGGINIGGTSGGGGGGNYLNVNASNLSSAGKKVFDGQWKTAVHQYMASYDLTNTTGASVKTTIDMAQYLPDDSFTYEVLVTWWLNATVPTTDNTTNTINCAIDHNIVGDSKIYSYFGNATASKINSVTISNYNIGSAIVVVSPERIIKIVTYNGGKGQMADFSQMAYRRVGSNQ